MTMKSEILAAVRAKCMDCCGDSPLAVKECGGGCCALYPYRSGIDPRPADGKVAAARARHRAGGLKPPSGPCK
jgi:hypothetical protein